MRSATLGLPLHKVGTRLEHVWVRVRVRATLRMKFHDCSEVSKAPFQSQSNGLFDDISLIPVR